MYVGTNNGVFFSNDKGNNWLPLDNASLPDTAVSALTIVGNYLFAGTMRGVAKYNLTITGFEQQNSQNNFSIYPNPTTGNLYIQLPPIGTAMVSLFNEYGQNVLNTEVNASESNNTVPLHLEKEEKGLYFLKIQGNESTFMKKIILE
jgi:hypothetical protein